MWARSWQSCLTRKSFPPRPFNAKIDKGQGYIEGNFTSDSANSLANPTTLRFPADPVKVVESQTVGATLGADSIRRSLFAGIIGLLAVVLFHAAVLPPARFHCRTWRCSRMPASA